MRLQSKRVHCPHRDDLSFPTISQLKSYRARLPDNGVIFKTVIFCTNITQMVRVTACHLRVTCQNRSISKGHLDISKRSLRYIKGSLRYIKRSLSISKGHLVYRSQSVSLPCPSGARIWHFANFALVPQKAFTRTP